MLTTQFGGIADPVGVVRKLAGHGDDHVDILFLVEINNVCLDYPVGIAFATVGTIEKIENWSIGVSCLDDDKWDLSVIHGR